MTAISSKPNMNLFLLKSIPLDRNLKRYYINKYRQLCSHNGMDYANAKFKQLNSALKRYKATGNLPSPGVRKNGWFKKLVSYTDSQPHYVFNFLKGLTSWRGEIDVDDASVQFDSKLRSIDSNYPVPKFMTAWLAILSLPSNNEIRKTYSDIRKQRTNLFHSYVRHHSLKEWMSYWSYWKKVFRTPSTQPQNRDRPVFPEVYKDFSDGSSQSHERDIVDFLLILFRNPDISANSREYLMSFVSQDVKDLFFDFDLEAELAESTEYQAKWSGFSVGDIHYIPKSGTDFRPIAVPNRLLQSGLVPIYNRLKSSVQRIRSDATFDQDKFDTWIQSRVTTDSRFIGSVDLSSATEYLPLDWSQPIVDLLLWTSPSECDYSWRLFNEMSRASWRNGTTNMSRWKVGQPLGSLPSFMVLSLTHNIFCESLSLMNGYGHSPYRILGDDIVLSSKKLYGSYIREMEKRGIPLSHSKSYSGKLTEFAGKTYIKKNIPFLTPDHNIITWQSLFDWQYSTGIRVPWNLLPKNIRNRVTRLSKGLNMSGQSLYQYAQLCCVYDRGTSYTSIKTSENILENYFAQPSKEEENIVNVSTGIVQFLNRVIVVSDDLRPIHGRLFRRYLQTSLPEWFKSKYRPTTTDKVFSNTIIALREAEVIRKD